MLGGLGHSLSTPILRKKTKTGWHFRRTTSGRGLIWGSSSLVSFPTLWKYLRVKLFALAHEPERDIATQVATSLSIKLRPSLMYKRLILMSTANGPILRLGLSIYVLFHSPGHSRKTICSTSLPASLAHLATSSSTSSPTPIKRKLIYFWISVVALFFSFFVFSPPDSLATADPLCH